MDKKSLSIRIGSLIFLIFFINIFTFKFYWYFSIWYFDMLMHLLGGFWLGLVAVYLFSPPNPSIVSMLKIFSFVLLVGLGWEIFEILTNDYIASNPFNVLDTFSDFFFNLSGGALSILYFLKKFTSNHKNTV